MEKRYNYRGMHNITADEAIQLMASDGVFEFHPADSQDEETDKQVKDEHADVTSYEQEAPMCVSYDYELLQPAKKPWWQIW